MQYLKEPKMNKLLDFVKYKQKFPIKRTKLTDTNRKYYYPVAVDLLMPLNSIIKMIKYFLDLFISLRLFSIINGTISLAIT